MQSDIQKSPRENEVASLKKNLKEMPENMKKFSKSMRSLYKENAVGTSTEAARKFTQLRDDTRQDAILFFKCHLPIINKFVSSIKEYFEYYDALRYDEWYKELPDILEETTTCKELANTVLEICEEIVESLTKRESEAKIIMTNLKDVQRKNEDQKDGLDAAAQPECSKCSKCSFRRVLSCLCPCIHRVNHETPLLNTSVDEEAAIATAVSAQSNVSKAAASVVAEELIPALASFVKGLSKIAGFFGVIEKELESFKGKREGKEESSKRSHYELLRKEAKEIRSLCQAFYAVLPDVRTDFAAIPNKGTDQNFIDKWLENKLKEIQKKRGPVQKYILAVFKGNNAEKN